MSELNPQLITEISNRLLEEARAAAAGLTPGWGHLPAFSQGSPVDVAPLSPTALPVPPTTPPVDFPSTTDWPDAPHTHHLASIGPHQADGAISSGANAFGLTGTRPEPTGSTADGVRNFVQRVQSSHHASRSGLCLEDSFKVPNFTAPISGAGTPRSISDTARPLDLPAIRRDFPILQELVHGKPLVWFDNAATTQKPNSVINALSNYYAHDNSNIHRGAHTLAARATDAFEAAREKVQRFLGSASANEIIFVRGATEGINLVAQTYGKKFLQPGDEIIVSTLEHHANIVPWQIIARERGAVLRVIPVNDRGEIMLEEYERLLGSRTRLVAISHASNSLGTILPISEMIQMAKRYNARVLIDGAQTVAHIPVNVQQLGCDFFVFSGHKIYGPTGIGAVFASTELQEIMPPWQSGGNMIRNVTFEETTYAGPPAKFEAGTPNIADAVGLGAALDYVQRLGLQNISKYEHELLSYATDALSPIPGLRLIGTARDKVAVISMVLAGKKTEEVGRMLDLEGIAVRAGHHCAQPSLKRFGLDSTVRMSLAFYNTRAEIDHFVRAIRRIQGA